MKNPLADVLRQSSGSDIPADSELCRWARLAYRDEQQAEVALAIVDSDTMQTLNRDYRSKDKPTNVLAFANATRCEDGIVHLGDVVLCADVIGAEANAQGKTTQAHWAHVTIHGMLHLQHYDHIEASEAREMEALETELLATLGIADPYQAIPADQTAKTAGRAR